MNLDNNSLSQRFEYCIKQLLLITITVLLLIPTSTPAEVLSGKVVSVADGDTNTILGHYLPN
jgi:hypothetical protein